MIKLLTAATFGAGALAASCAFAAEKSVTLSVENMTCVSCPYIVKQSLAAVPGVKTVVVSFADKSAIVTYDDARVSTAALVSATTNAGFPSAARD